MTFYDVISGLCKETHTSPTTVSKQLGLSTSMPTQWKNGTIPNGDTLLKIAAYFDVSVDYLLGRTDIKSMASASVSNAADMQLLESFHRLNEIGKKRVQDTVDDLMQIQKYTEKLSL